MEFGIIGLGRMGANMARRLGRLVAVLVLLAVGLLAWRRRAEISARLGVAPILVGLLLLTQLVFSVGYSLDFVQGLVTGVLVSAMAGRAPAPATASTEGSRRGRRLSPAPVRLVGR